MPTAEEQKRWRTRLGETSPITVQLDQVEVGLLDLIGKMLYEGDPHDPPRQISSITPGRAAAIRWLIHRWAEEQGLASITKKRRRLPGREEMAEFWRAEACWRRTRRAPKPDKGPFRPSPPWKAH